MSKILDCDEAECAFCAQGETSEEVVQVVAAHIKNEHEGRITARLFAELRAAIRET